jgi:outer membrane protein
VFKENFKFLPIINSIVLLLILSFVFISFYKNNDKIVSVNNLKLFDEFKMTKEMKSIGNKEYSSKKIYLDSLYLKLQEQDLEKNAKEILMKEFVSKREEFDQFNQSFAVEESDKIWKRINSYTKQFAKNNGYKVVLGLENSREVLYTDESIDVTNELLFFINKKYEGL